MDITKGMITYVSLFKDWQDTLLDSLQGNRYNPECIFRVFYGDDLAERTVTVADLNSYFDNVASEVYGAETQKFVIPALRHMIALMEFLQGMYQKNDYHNPHKPYEYASLEYPERYKALVLGLSDDSLQMIENFDMEFYREHISEDQQREFVERMREHKELFLKYDVVPKIPQQNLKMKSINGSSVEISGVA